MPKKKYRLIFLIVLSTLNAYPQQTVQFSQYVFNGLAVNPAYAGYKDDLTANLSYRMQWTGLNGAPRTGTASADGTLGSGNKNVGLGLIATTDRIGPQLTSSVFVNYSYRLRLDANDTRRLCFGIAFGAVQYRLDASKFNANDPIDYSIPVNDQSRVMPDMRLGLYYYSTKFYAGASVLNLLQTDVNAGGSNLVNPQRHAYLTVGAMLPLNHMLDIKPSVMLKEDFTGPTNADFSSYVVIGKKLWLGASWRTAVPLWNKPALQNGLDKNDAMAALVQVYASPRFRVGYSFDFTTSKLARYQNGSHEISVGLSFWGKHERILSPRFF